MEADLMEYALLSFEGSSFGAQMTIGEACYPASFGTIGFGGRFTGAGFTQGSEATIVLRRSVYAGVGLKVGMPLSVKTGNGCVRKFKVAKDGIRDCIFAWEITLDDQNQGA